MIKVYNETDRPNSCYKRCSDSHLVNLSTFDTWHMNGWPRFLNKVTKMNKLTKSGSHKMTSWEAFTIMYTSLNKVAVIFPHDFNIFHWPLKKYAVFFFIYEYFCHLSHTYTQLQILTFVIPMQYQDTQAWATSNL